MNRRGTSLVNMLAVITVLGAIWLISARYLGEVLRAGRTSEAQTAAIPIRGEIARQFRRDVHESRWCRLKHSGREVQCVKDDEIVRLWKLEGQGLYREERVRGAPTQRSLWNIDSALFTATGEGSSHALELTLTTAGVEWRVVAAAESIRLEDSRGETR